MQKQGSIISGIVLILVGSCFLALQLFPGVARTINFSFLWPLIILGVGGMFFLGAFLGTRELVIPGTIISGVGAILFYQNSSGNWDFWQLWLLMPAIIGLGIILDGVLAGRGGRSLGPGLVPLIIGLVLFTVFTAGSWFFDLWPLGLVLLGIILLVRNARHKMG